MSGTPFVTKFTLGLLTIEPCPQNPDGSMDVEEKSAEIIAAEQAARDVIKAKKRAKELKRNKSRSVSPSKPDAIQKKKDDKAERLRKLEEEKETNRLAEEEAANRLAEEEEANRLAEEAEAKRFLAEEEANRLAEEDRAREAAEARKIAEKKAEEAAKLRKEQEDARRVKEFEAVAAQEARRRLAEEQAKAAIEAKRPKLARRVSFFPCTKDNSGLNAAMKRYGGDFPFDWEKPEWTMNFGTLKHAVTYKGMYGWERPEWTRNQNLRRVETHLDGGAGRWQQPEWALKSPLRKSIRGDRLKGGARLERPIALINFTDEEFDDLGMSEYSNYSDCSLIRRHSFSEHSIASFKPTWARDDFLKPTKAGELIKRGENLALPIAIIKKKAMDEDLTLEESWASLNNSRNIGWEKPEWTKPHLKITDTGTAVRQGANLALPAVIPPTKDREDVLDNHMSFNGSMKNIGWEKPSWAKDSGLRKTIKGELMKEKGTLAKPITYKSQP